MLKFGEDVGREATPEVLLGNPVHADRLRAGQHVVDDGQVEQHVLLADPRLPLHIPQLILTYARTKGALSARLAIGYGEVGLVVGAVARARHLRVDVRAVEWIRVRDKFHCTLCNKVYVLGVFLGPEDDLVLLVALLLKAWVQSGHVRVGVILQRWQTFI